MAVTAGQSDAAGSAIARPQLARQETELLMSYYQSPLADQGIGYPTRPHHHRRTLSGDSGSTSSSDYSSGSDHSEPQVQSSTRRASAPSAGGSDRRRLAIVQMDTVQESEPKTSSVRARRGLETRLDGLALVAPPDASPNSYAYLSQPSSAPPIPRSEETTKDKTHNRSASEAASHPLRTKSSRDVGIVGTSAVQSPRKPRLQITSETLLPVPPIFQEPHSSRASTPANCSPLFPPPKRRSTDISVHTPEIGQPKDIHVPVASPVVVNLGPDASLRVGSSTFDRHSPALQARFPFGHSQPLAYISTGVHAIAGPLPAPPRAIVNIDPSSPPPPRPPRMHSPPPRRKGDHLASVSAVLSSGSSSPSTSRSISPAPPIDVTSSGEEETLHRREGAFSPSTISTTPSTSPSEYSPAPPPVAPAIDGMIPAVSKESPAVSSAPQMETLPERSPAEEWTYVSRDLTASPSYSDEVESQDHVSWESFSPRQSHERGDGHGATPSPPPKSLRNSLTANFKRFSSLPRTPSPSHNSLSRSSSYRSRGPSSPPASVVPLPTRAPLVKSISRNPPAMSCADIVTRKSAQERCALYAQKINELYVHDCGLSKWVLDAHFRVSIPSNQRAAFSPTTPRSQVRHVSRSSMQSEATFPRRPDAMVATDLSTKPADIAPTAPTIPYPALSPRGTGANVLPSSMRMLGATSPTPSSKAGTFFSSLGRKSSMSKKERPNPMALALGSATTTRLVKPPPAVKNNPRPVVLTNAPVVPGGPRAPPNRAMRTQSIMAGSPFSSNASMSVSDHMSRRPSLFTPSTSSSSEARSTVSGASRGSPDFDRQVDKLADLLPQADRTVLAGYLRRCGQDIVAIGQYLEDEKNGTLRRD
ncbi:hypothetical protein FB45DRAFT_1023352 [Roridomyces roridus]|uniref:Uncharacterized protein n=1 Tax=Roridomyces roridus TaxID=1738132 RepID=A0AAD7C465_9AGAR|nr:hypothetical protein FB45DRAFT_1023352 [Roridomyces roridus]